MFPKDLENLAPLLQYDSSPPSWGSFEGDAEQLPPSLCIPAEMSKKYQALWVDP
jgi:hypothetical protein